MEQSVDQFASTHAASSFFSQLSAKFRSCPSFSESDTKGTLRWAVHSRSTQRVGGHQVLQLAEGQTDSAVPDLTVPIDVLWTVSGADVYMFSSIMLNVSSPQPTLSSLTLKLIARVSGLR